VLAKLSFGATVAILFALGRADIFILAFAAIDTLIAAGFALAWRLSGRD
jgi:hypothetical protein